MIPEQIEQYILHDETDQPIAPESKPFRDVYYDALSDMLFPVKATRLHLFPTFNDIVGGFRPNEFSILCGATGSGKTTLAANWSADLVLQNIPHYVASVETGPKDFIRRVMSCIANEDWNNGDAVSKEKVQAFDAKYGQTIKNSSLHLGLYENRVSVERLMSDIAAHVQEHKIKLAIIDNMNFLLEVKRSSDLIVEMDRVVHELIIFCKEVPVHIVMVMHPKKTEEGRVESEFDVKGSSTSVQEAQNVFLWNRPSEDLINQGQCTKFDRELKIAKMRRRGKAVGQKLILSTRNGVSYQEKARFE